MARYTVERVHNTGDSGTRVGYAVWDNVEADYVGCYSYEHCPDPQELAEDLADQLNADEHNERELPYRVTVICDGALDHEGDFWSFDAAQETFRHWVDELDQYVTNNEDVSYSVHLYDTATCQDIDRYTYR